MESRNELAVGCGMDDGMAMMLAVREDHGEDAAPGAGQGVGDIVILGNDGLGCDRHGERARFKSSRSSRWCR